MHLSNVQKAVATAAVVIIGAGVTTATAHAATGLAPGIHAANLKSSVAAGYLLNPAPASATANTTFVVPTLTCPASGTQGDAPGALIFTGSGASASLSGASVFVVCQNGTAFYQASAVVDGTGKMVAVSPAPGDSITISVSVTATKTGVTFSDTTQSFTKKFKGAGATPAVVLDGIDSLVDNTNTQLPNANFHKISFSASKIDGQTLAASGAKAFDMVSSAHVLQIKTSALDSTGQKFTETFKHA
jgi:hypothetical protein